MRGKPRGQYGPTGERNSGIRYVPPKEQREMVDQWQEQQDRIAALEAALHTRNGELLVARMELDMLRDDVRRAIALLPADPGAALAILIDALYELEAHQASQVGPGDVIGE